MNPTDEQIKALEEELRKTKYNKKTQHHIGLVKAKIARLKEREITKAKGKGVTTGYAVKKTGDGTAVLVGFPSVGKSTILNAATSANSKIAAYEFTTLEVVPGMLEHNHTKIQILDVPGLITGASEGKGRGREILSVVRIADMIIFVIELLKPKQLKHIMDELYGAGVRINKTRPSMEILKSEKGGLKIIESVKQTHMELNTIESILREHRVNNAEVRLREDFTDDRLIDGILGNRLYLKGLIVVNKTDQNPEKVKSVRKKIEKILPDTKIVFISAQESQGIDELKDAIFETMGFYRIFLKQIGKKPDLEEPMILQQKPSIEDVCNKIHRNFMGRFRFARVWGKSAKFAGQKFMANHELEDLDIIEIHLR